jgi:hypothetical protein
MKDTEADGKYANMPIGMGFREYIKEKIETELTRVRKERLEEEKR